MPPQVNDALDRAHPVHQKGQRQPDISRDSAPQGRALEKATDTSIPGVHLTDVHIWSMPNGYPLVPPVSTHLSPSVAVRANFVRVTPLLSPPITTEQTAEATDTEEHVAPPETNMEAPIKVNESDQYRDVRIHIQPDGDGLRVWLGLDIQRLPDLPAIAEFLNTWSRQQGKKLTSMVCNGQELTNSINPMGATHEYQRRHGKQQFLLQRQSDLGGLSEGHAHTADPPEPAQANG